MQTIGLVHNPEKEKAGQLAHEIAEWLCGRKKTVYTITDEIPEAIDMIISIGGDGTLLHLAGRLKERPIPVLGVNAGSLGFLTSVKASEIFTELEFILAGRYTIETRSMISATISGQAENVPEHFDVLNDVVINREGLTRFLTSTILVDRSPLTQFGGDGVILATATGSTAYSLSAGGPFLYPTLKDILITPLCPHSLKTRPVIIPHGATIEVVVTCEEATDRALVSFDGQEKRIIPSGARITVTESAYTFRVVRSSQRSFYDVIHEKF